MKFPRYADALIADKDGSIGVHLDCDVAAPASILNGITQEIGAVQRLIITFRGYFANVGVE